MKRIFTVLTLLICAFVLYSCGTSEATNIDNEPISSAEPEKEYYENPDFNDIETFTSVTGVEATRIDSDEDGVTYSYLLDVDANGISSIIKYEAYLENCGFEKIEAEFNGYQIDQFVKDNKYILASKDGYQDKLGTYVILVPEQKTQISASPSPTPSKESTPSPSIDEAALYSEFCKLVDDEKYTDAVEYKIKNRMSMEYLDTRNYYNYAKGMKLYKETEFLSFADIQTVLECLTISSGFKDSDEIVEKINSDLNLLIGHYLYVELEDRWGNYIGHDIIIREDGYVGMASLHEKGEDPFYLSHQLCYLNLEKNSCYAICSEYSPAFEECAYVFVSFTGDSIHLLPASWYKGPKLHSGQYTKLS